MQEDLASIQDYFSIIERRKWSLVVPALLVFATALIAAFTLPPIYRSTSTILIEAQEIPREFVASTVTGFADQRLQMINQRVMISTKLLDIVKRFNLYPEERKTKTTEEVITRMRNDITFKTISADVVDSRTERPSAATIAFSLSYEGPQPELVQQVAGVLTSLFLEENLKVRAQQSAGAFKFLEEEARELKEQLNTLDAAISDLKKTNMDALPELLQINLQGLDRTERDIDQMNDQLRTLREKKSNFQSQLASIPTDSDSQDKTLLKELKARLVQLESRYSDKYPDVIKTRTEIAKLEDRLRAQPTGGQEKPDNPAYVTLVSQLAGIQSEIESVKRQIEGMRRKRDEYRQRIETMPKVDEAYKGLMSERNNIQVKYDDLMRKSMEAKVSKGLEKEQMGERFNLIEPARLPEKPVKPNIPAILMIGLVLGIGSGIGTASIREFSDRSVRSAKELSRATALPVLGNIPEIVTWGDRKRLRIRRVWLVVAGLAVMLAAIAAFHYFVMDLDVLWAKILRRIDG
jgi:polysaccharide biosynthesis transport protein